jgi:hypothetical protein
MVRSLGTLLLTLCSTVLVRADMVVADPAGTGQWYAGVTATNASGAFWDNLSGDGNYCNVGFFLQETTSWNNLGCPQDGPPPAYLSGDHGPGPLSFFASTSGMGTPVGFLLESTGPSILTMRVEDAGSRNTNTFGYYETDALGNIIAPKTEVFSGPDAPDATRVLLLKPGSFYELYLDPVGNAANEELSGMSDKFALFSQVPTSPNTSSDLNVFWIGIEDRGGLGEGFGDYNDMVISVSPIPEPDFFGVLALALSGMFCLVIRRHRSESNG